MPLEASHIRFSLDIKDKLGVRDIGKYISGIIYPDSRYVTKLERELTHPADFLEDDFFKKDDFRKGWYSHLLYDKIKKDYTKAQLPEIFSEIHGETSELWIRLTALKILQDVDDVRAYDIKMYLPYLDYIENPNGEDIKVLRTYNRYFQEMYANPEKVSFESCYGMWRFFGIGEALVEKLQLQTEEYKNDSRIRAFLDTVYMQILKI